MSKSPKQVALSAEKLRLLEALLREEGARYNSFPLSFAQEGLWFLDQLQPGSPAYNIHAAVRFEGALDVSAFERSLREIVRRHEVLRASFPAVNGRPVQV
ncbi:MAG: condensation domain-containing protein, partial [Pyrinomonadaceae bacterium]